MARGHGPADGQHELLPLGEHSSTDGQSPASVQDVSSKPQGAVLFVGGTRSGKSDMALRFAEAVCPLPSAPAVAGTPATMAASSHLCTPRLFIATALVRDAETRARMERHQAQRGAGWRTVEEPHAVLDALQQAVGHAGVIVVDCIPFWLCNLQEQGLTSPQILDAVGKVAAWLATAPLPVAVVSAEVGQGIVPVSALGRAYRDLAGEANQILAAACPTVVLVSCGLPLALKGCIPKEVV